MEPVPQTVDATTDISGLARPDLLGPLLAEATGDPGWKQVEPQLITGGKSNLTFLLVSPAGELIMRRPPSGAILATAHDMTRETTVQRALAPTAVPVPGIVLADSGDLAGFSFYVMTKVPGLVIRDELPPGVAGTAAQRTALGNALVDTLADLHSVDPASVGLGSFGRPAGFAERQVRRWRKQMAATSTAATSTGATSTAATSTEPGPATDALDALAERLLRKLPRPGPGTIVHGDYRLDNCVIDAGSGAVNGVLDWEMATVGDPLTDLGMLLFYWEAVGRLIPTLVPCHTSLPGFPGLAEVAERWSGRTGIAIDELDWYLAFAHFKFAGIAQGVQARAEAGAMAGQDFGNLTAPIAALAEAGLAVPAI